MSLYNDLLLNTKPVNLLHGSDIEYLDRSFPAVQKNIRMPSEGNVMLYYEEINVLHTQEDRFSPYTALVLYRLGSWMNSLP